MGKTEHQETITIKEIARLANVSSATVSLVLNCKPGVSQETRYRVQTIAKSLHYTPNLVARSLVQRRSQAVAMLVSDIRTHIFPEIAAGVDDVLRKSGYSLSIISTYDSGQAEAHRIEGIRARGVDGIITSASLIHDAGICELARSGYPVVSVMRRVYNCDELDYITVDNVKGGFLATEHLIRLGHARLGFIKGPVITSTGVERFDGAMKAMSLYGLSVSADRLKQGDYSKKSGYEAAMAMMKLPEGRRPDAIFAGNDDMALGAFEAAYDLGISIPGDLALVGFNNVETTALRTIEITTISQRKEKIGSLAAGRLLDRIEGTKDIGEPLHLLLEPELIIRSSCGYSIHSSYVIDQRKGS